MWQLHAISNVNWVADDGRIRYEKASNPATVLLGCGAGGAAVEGLGEINRKEPATYSDSLRSRFVCRSSHAAQVR